MKRSEKPSTKNGQEPYDINAPRAAAPFTASDLPIDDEGRSYHLQAKPGQIAPDILLVGDPGRAEFIGSNFLRDLEFEHEHRGLITLTGTSEITGEQATIISPVRTTVTTSGMGTSSLEIVVSELVALNEIDFETRTRKSSFPRLHIIRVGSSGGLQASTELGTLIITTYAIGLDNTGLYYETPYLDEICTRLEGELYHILNHATGTKSRFYGKIHPYVTRAEPTLVSAMLEAATSLGVPTRAGLTVSAPGFFAPEGRDIARVKPSIPDLDKIFSDFEPQIEGQRVENMEMETSFLTHFLGGLGYWAGSICPAIANRQQDTFTAHYQEAMKNAVKVALQALVALRNRYPDVRISG
jgi:uridine phosphorylase